ncbi:MAG: hypothetical protein M1814_004482 [Vezdaea aestivalis]|nr:MAG: hypothetical protein M1814_004482 [Vezdaea aestivalis]
MPSTPPFPGGYDLCLDRAQTSLHTRCRPPSTSLSSLTPPSLPLPFSNGPWTRQKHLLSLRSAGFKGSLLNLSNVSCENSPPSLSIEKRSFRSPPRQFRRLSLSTSPAVFEETNAWRSFQYSMPKGHRSHSGFDLASDFSSFTDPVPLFYTKSQPISYGEAPLDDTKMRLREVSLNPRTPPSSTKSPMVRNMKGRSKRSLNLRSTSFEASKYIDHLESELEATQLQLQNLASPSTSQAQQARTRSLETENQTFRQQLTTWEEKFYDRLQGELEDRIELEGGLRAKIKFLEKERESKISRITELEDRIELEGGLRAKISFLEKERESKDNRIVDLDERLQDMTKEMLRVRLENGMLRQRTAQGPFRGRSGPATPGSTVGDEENVPDFGSRPESRDSSASIADQFDFEPESSAMIPSAFAVDPMHQSRRYPHQENRLNTEVESPLQGYFGGSRPSSIALSSTCYSPIAENGTNMAPGIRSKVPSAKRRMRRFSAGASGPKTLILPATQSAEDQPASAPPGDVERPWNEINPRSRGSRHGQKANFQGRPLSETNDKGGGKRSSWTHEQTLQILESNAVATPATDKSKRDSLREAHRTSWASTTARKRDLSRNTLRARPQSLYAELSNVQEGDPDLWGQTTPLLSQGARSEEEFTPTNKARRVSLNQSGPRRNMRYHQRSESAITHTKHESLREMVAHTWQDPISLARRVVLNAWAIGPKSEGMRETGWWLLSLIIGQEKCKSKRRSQGRMEELLKDEMGVDASHRRWIEFIAEQFDVPATVDGPLGNTPKDSSTPARCQSCAPEASHGVWPWAKFSAALILALSIAIRDGPAVLVDKKAEHRRDVSAESTAMAPEYSADNEHPSHH